MEPEPSLHSLCICKSPLIPLSQLGFSARVACACDIVRNPLRISGAGGNSGGSLIQRRMCFSRVGPTPDNSVNDRFWRTISEASSSQRSARRAARRRAFCKGGRVFSDSLARSSAIIALLRHSDLHFKDTFTRIIDVTKL